MKKKLENDSLDAMDNIHNWMWNANGQGIASFENFTHDENLSQAIKTLKFKGIQYDEILVDEGQDSPSIPIKF